MIGATPGGIGSTPGGIGSTPGGYAATPIASTPSGLGAAAAVTGIADETVRKVPRNANRMLFVKKWPKSAAAEALWKAFTEYGIVREVRKDRKTGALIVVYDELKDAVEAKSALNQSMQIGRVVHVDYYKPKIEAPK